MTVHSPELRRSNSTVLLLVGLVALVAPIFIDRAAGGGAVLTGAMPALGVPLGCAALLNIHILIGGSWGFALRPVLVAMVRTLPAMAPALLSIAIAANALYPWSGHGAGVRTDVTKYFLNVPLFWFRLALIAASCVAVAWAALKRRRRPLISAIALVVYAIAISFAAVDWVMSLEPRWSSTLFGALVAISQIGMGLGCAAILQWRDPPTRTTEDLAQLLLAAVLGLAYLCFMQYLVMWSGNLPEKVDYFVRRDAFGWNVVLLAATVIGALAPFLMLMMRPARKNPRVVGLAGLCVVFGLVLLWLWQIVPALSRVSWVLTVCAAAGLCCLMFGFAGDVRGARLRRPGHE